MTTRDTDVAAVTTPPGSLIPSLRCVGFGEREGVCENEAGGPPRDNPIWCGECDTARIEYLSGQFQKIKESFGGN